MAAKSVVEIDVQDEKFQAFWKNSMNTRRRSKNFRSNGEARRRGSVIQPSRRKRCWAARRR